MDSMDSMDPVNPVDPELDTDPRPDTVRAPGKAEAAARLRARAGALFGTAEEEPPTGVPGVRAFAGGRMGRLRQWLFVRCGLEFRTVAALAVVLAVAAGLALHHYWAGRPRTVRVPPPVAMPVPTPATRPAPLSKLTVDIAGKVARPGLRRLPEGSRVADALTAAGGPLPGTDTTPLNLARPLTDGEQVLVGVTPPPPPPPLSVPAASSAGPAPTGPLSLNSATAAQLDALPGVGPVLAQHILDFRTRHGAFTSPGQLRQIPGIGPRKFATLQPLVHP
ncbi:ComEA family DNA-binding protein [Actinacidiphila sp. ITFR-21]|uniref:ComEA family DNA-binding protein n=1 Tax=Actinacidiphila sp. ITFR-21 TaxID=3075199 RepID=UPI00288AF039|nr:ComEA family DNA-binding protein [Streptomyces sp. ITFR-21]WNI15453.1 ComEA family DNA-binding protein [Streptomyces sp. ITFR-21]